MQREPDDHIKITLATGITLRIPTRFSHYDYVRTLGEGSSSAVILVRDSVSKLLLACKVVSREYLTTAGIFARFEQEVRLLPLLVHPSIVRFERVVYHPELIFVLMEYCSHGDLLTHIVESGVLAEYEARDLFSQIVRAVHFIHSKGIVHRDLKPENVLLDEVQHAKLCDFGLCSVVGPRTLLTTRCGSPFYVPPEIVAKEPYDGRMADVWSLGVMLYTMVTGALPWSTKNQVALFKEISAGCPEIPTTISPLLGDMLVAMLQRNPCERMTVAQLLQCPWLAPPKRPLCRHAWSMSALLPSAESSQPPGSAHAGVRSRKLLVRPDVRGDGAPMASMTSMSPVFPAVRNPPMRKSFMWA
jgi:serine/threonine protein kinase